MGSGLHQKQNGEEGMRKGKEGGAKKRDAVRGRGIGHGGCEKTLGGG